MAELSTTHAREVETLNEPFRKIVEWKSTEWSGTHIHFKGESFETDESEESEPNKWHCGTGSYTKAGRLNYQCALKANVAYIDGADPDKKGTRSTAMREFLQNAKKGDNLFLHGAQKGMKKGMCTHVGIYTGEIQSYKDSYNGYKFEEPPEDSYPDGWKMCHPENSNSTNHYLIKVEEWIPLQEPFELPIKRVATLFNATNIPGYP